MASPPRHSPPAAPSYARLVCVCGKRTHTYTSFSTEKRSRVVFLGENGNGKTTLVKLIMGALEATSGEIFRSPHARVALVNQQRAASLWRRERETESSKQPLRELWPHLRERLSPKENGSLRAQTPRGPAGPETDAASVHEDQVRGRRRVTPETFFFSLFPRDSSSSAPVAMAMTPGSYDHEQKLRGHLSSCGVTGQNPDLQNARCAELAKRERYIHIYISKSWRYVS